MHILILNWRDPLNPKSGGAEIVTLEHAKAWIKKGHTVTWFAQHFPQSKSNERFENIEIVRRGNFLTVILFAPFYYFFSKKEFDVVIDEIHGFPFFTPFYVRKAKIIAFIHEVAGEIWDYMYPFPISAVGKLLEKIMFIPYRRIPFLTVSESTQKELADLGIHKIVLIHNGFSFPAIKYNFEKGKDPTFIFVSRLVKMKGIEEVLKAFSFIVNEYKHAKLRIVGSGDERYITKLRQCAKEVKIDKQIQFYGKVTETRKYELLNQSHILLHASVKEGWGLVVIEGASQGIPSIVYNVAGLRDSVKNNKTGIVVKNNTPIDMAKEAIALYEDKKKYHTFEKNCVEWAKSLTWQKSTQKSLELLASL